VPTIGRLAALRPRTVLEDMVGALEQSKAYGPAWLPPAKSVGGQAARHRSTSTRIRSARRGPEGHRSRSCSLGARGQAVKRLITTPGIDVVGRSSSWQRWARSRASTNRTQSRERAKTAAQAYSVKTMAIGARPWVHSHRPGRHRELSLENRQFANIQFRPVSGRQVIANQNENGRESCIKRRDFVLELAPSSQVMLELCKSPNRGENLLTLIEVLTADASRHRKDAGVLSLVTTAATRRTFRPVLTLRLCQWSEKRWFVIRWFFKLLHRLAQSSAGMDLPYTLSAGPGLMLIHGWGIVINQKATLGSNVTLFNGVVIGQKDIVSSEGRTINYPTIGSEVWIGAHAIILGVAIGEGAIVGPGSVVTKDVPAHCVVVGNPARILRRDAIPDVPNRAILER